MKASPNLANRTKKIFQATLPLMLVVASQTAKAQSGALQWSSAMSGGDQISGWLKGVMLAVMAVFVMTSIILGSLAFKQLGADGNWKDFWSKIAGAIGMFVTPIAIYWLANKQPE